MNTNEWIAKQLSRLPRKRTEMIVSSHAVDEAIHDGIDEREISRTVREGAVFVRKCEWSDKICFQRYDGKKNRTCVVVARFDEREIRVVTLWAKNGR